VILVATRPSLADSYTISTLLWMCDLDSKQCHFDNDT
jgi:hypothetical protein